MPSVAVTAAVTLLMVLVLVARSTIAGQRQALPGLDAGEVHLRARRQADDKDSYQVEISFPAQSGPVTNDDTKQAEDVQKLIEDIILKQGQFDVNSQLPNVETDPSSLQLDSEFICEEGKVLVDRWCVACAAGTYFDKESRTCRKCPIGTYQSGLGQTNCTKCPEIAGKHSTTAMRGAQTPDLCKERCPAGRFFDSKLQMCKPCGVGFYQDRAGQFSCYPCENGLTTRGDESTSSKTCTAACEDGKQLAEDNTCQPCPRGTFRSKDARQTCAACPQGTTTPDTGATVSEDCSLPVCLPGSFLSVTDGSRCVPCPLATYQPESLQTECTPCPPDTTTAQVGSSAVTECINPCDGGDDADRCDANAICLIDAKTSAFKCECKLGFHGDGMNCTDRCQGFCQNGGACTKDERTGLPACACAGSFTGDQCVEKSQFAYIVGGVAGFVVLAIICVLFVWMICVRSNKKKQPEVVNKAMTLPPDAGSQMNFYYGTPAPYAESIAPSHHSNYAHYYDEEDDAWEMPNYYNEAYVRDGGKMGTLPHSGAPSMYGSASKQDELYDRLRKHAYTGKIESGESPEGHDDQPL